MSTEIRLYSGIYSFVADKVASEINDARGDIIMKINSPGGDVLAGWSIISKIKEYQSKGKKFNMKVEGLAASFAAFALMFADEVTALDVSRFMFHRADMMVQSEADQQWLDSVNADLKSKMLKKFSNYSFKDITGTSIDELFDPKQRIDVWIDAKKAKALGLIKEYVEVDPTDQMVEASIRTMNAHMVSMGVGSGEQENIEHKKELQSEKSNILEQKQKKKMTIEELKMNHPEVYAQAVAVGVSQEYDRVNAFMQFTDVDLEGAKKGIESKQVMSQTEMISFIQKKANVTALAALETASPKEVVPAETKVQAEAKKDEKSDSEKEMELFMAEAQKSALAKLGIEVK